MSLPLLVKKDGTLHFEEGNLEKTLHHNLIEDRPIAIVSVAGPCRMGKSFFLNLIHKYYSAHGWKNKNWLEDFDSSKDCTIKWSPGKKSHTQGIVISETPLIVERPDGSEIAVILLDTQGNFDNGSEKEESLAVFSLSTLFSSLQIFNVSKLIQSVDLEYLEFFVKYTVKAKKNSKSNNKSGRLEEKNKKYFQDLAFLVRDWPNEDEHNYGLEGGKEYLMSIGEKSEDYENIENTFEHLYCYLMPEPGLNVRKASKNANLTMKNLGDDFTTHMNQVTEKLLHPDKLSTKGVRINCLVNFMKDYAKAVLDGKYLDFPTMMQLMAEHEIKKVIECVYQDFEDNITRLEREHAQALENARQKFEENMASAIKDIEESEETVWENLDSRRDEFIQEAVNESFANSPFEIETNGENEIRDTLRLYKEKHEKEMQQKRVSFLKQKMKEWQDETINSLKSHKKGYLYTNPSEYDKIIDVCERKLLKPLERDSEEAFEEQKQCTEEVMKALQKTQQKVKKRNKTVLKHAITGAAVAAVSCAVPAVIGAVVIGEVAIAASVGGTASVLGFVGFMKKKVDNLDENGEELRPA